MIRTLIVDDEPVARQILREELETFPDIVIAGEAENGSQALQKISELHPDLVFLDEPNPGPWTGRLTSEPRGRLDELFRMRSTF